MCDKKRFPSRALALQRLHEINTKGEQKDTMPLRAYYCRECGGWHLTSKKLSGKYKGRETTAKKKVAFILAEYWIRKKNWE